MAVGAARNRRTSTNPPHRFKLRWKLDSREFAIFMNWGHLVLQDFTAWFSIPLASSRQRIELVTCQFTDSPEWSAVSGGCFSVSAELEARDYPHLTAEELAALIAWRPPVPPVYIPPDPPPVDPPPVVPPTVPVGVAAVWDNLGELIYPQSWGIATVWNPDGSVAYEQTSWAGKTWRRTYYFVPGAGISAVAQWIRQ